MVFNNAYNILKDFNVHVINLILNDFMVIMIVKDFMCIHDLSQLKSLPTIS